jgi:hypothetical protein
MSTTSNDHRSLAREKAIADGVKDVAAELRLIDIVNLIVYIQLEKHGNLDDLVASSVELYFKPDTLRYGWRAAVETDWSGPASVTLDMEFQNKGVTVFFSLILGPLKAGIEIHYFAVAGSSGDPEENTGRLIDAIADARLVPIT